MLLNPEWITKRFTKQYIFTIFETDGILLRKSYIFNSLNCMLMLCVLYMRRVAFCATLFCALFFNVHYNFAQTPASFLNTEAVLS